MSDGIDAQEALDYIGGMIAGWEGVLDEFAPYVDIDPRVASSSETLSIVVWALHTVLDRVTVAEVRDL